MSFVIGIASMIFSTIVNTPGNNGLNSHNPDADPVLFTIERSRDADYLVYEMKTINNGKPDPVDPIAVYWIKKDDIMKKESLTRIQKHRGYGIKILDGPCADNDHWQFRIMALSGTNFTLKQDSHHGYHVFVRLGSSEIRLEKLYINFTNNSFWSPEVSYIKVYGYESYSGERYEKTITPTELN